MTSLIRPEKSEVKWHDFAAKSLVLNLLPAEEFLFKFRSLTQSEAMCGNSEWFSSEIADVQNGKTGQSRVAFI